MVRPEPALWLFCVPSPARDESALWRCLSAVKMLERLQTIANCAGTLGTSPGNERRWQDGPWANVTDSGRCMGTGCVTPYEETQEQGMILPNGQLLCHVCHEKWAAHVCRELGLARGPRKSSLAYLWATLTLNPRRVSVDSPGFRVLYSRAGTAWLSPGTKPRRTITLLGSVLAENHGGTLLPMIAASSICTNSTSGFYQL